MIRARFTPYYLGLTIPIVYADYMFNGFQNINLLTETLKFTLLSGYTFNPNHSEATVLSYEIDCATFPAGGVTLIDKSLVGYKLYATSESTVFIDGNQSVNAYLIYSPGIGLVGVRVPDVAVTYQDAEITWPSTDLINCMTDLLLPSKYWDLLTGETLNLPGGYWDLEDNSCIIVGSLPALSGLIVLNGGIPLAVAGSLPSLKGRIRINTHNQLSRFKLRIEI
jgi:hypothetical protein